MKANGAPEKIYLFESPVSGTLVLEWMPKRLTKNDTEYTRTDAFIKRTCEWLSKHAKSIISIRTDTILEQMN